MAKTESMIERGSGNVFADLGYVDAGERKLRVQLAMEINKLLAERGLTQSASAELFGIAQPHVSELANYKLNRFSSERLMHFLTCLEQDVEIVVRPIKKSRMKSHGAITLSRATAF
jgi:predicted XRE-type DNA-binding protein